MSGDRKLSSIILGPVVVEPTCEAGFHNGELVTEEAMKQKEEEVGRAIYLLQGTKPMT